jgi:hypothetical protein
LTVFYNLRDFTEFEKMYLELPSPYQMSEDVISMKIKLSVIQEKQQEAILLLKKGKEYHKASGGSNPDFINELQSIIDDKSDIRLLRSTFLEIFSKKPKTLIQILSLENLRGIVRQVKVRKSANSVVTDSSCYVAKADSSSKIFQPQSLSFFIFYYAA